MVNLLRPRSALHCAHVLLALGLLFPASGWAQSYMGKVCLTFTITERQTGPVTEQPVASQLDVTNLGGNMYAVVGSLPAADQSQPLVVSGHATVIGSELYFNMTATLHHPDSYGWQDTGINQTRLNVSTMTGTFYEIGHDFGRLTRQFDNSRYTGGSASLSLAACPG
jgi:hypothetical protein